jgi:hypothetical protein
MNDISCNFSCVTFAVNCHCASLKIKSMTVVENLLKQQFSCWGFVYTRKISETKIVMTDAICCLAGIKRCLRETYENAMRKAFRSFYRLQRMKQSKIQRDKSSESVHLT